MSLSAALEQLAAYRTNNTRASQETFDAGVTVLKSKDFKSFGNEGWSFLEQLALAAVDVGRLDVADECIKQLSNKFPKSPRVEVLTGIRIEAVESPEVALSYYQELLDEDSTNTAIWKRRISVLRRMGRLEQAVEDLSKFLDTFYSDLEGWLELAEIYSKCNQYSHALESLSHALILAPQNPFTFLQFAETAYTAGDIPLALKMFLVVAEMSERDREIGDPPSGFTTRAWMGVKLCSRQLVSSKGAATSVSSTPVPDNLNLVDELATERVLASYRGCRDTGVAEIETWLGST